MKPKIFLRDGRWYCSSYMFCGARFFAGATPREAYLNWRSCYA